MDDAPLGDEMLFFPSMVINLGEEMHRCHLTVPWKHQACLCRTVSHSVLCGLVGSLPNSPVVRSSGFTILCLSVSIPSHTNRPLNISFL